MDGNFIFIKMNNLGNRVELPKGSLVYYQHKCTIAKPYAAKINHSQYP
jgi:hypothetical protein